MITKELLQESFPDFKVHHVRFTDYDFFLVTHKGYSFHIDVNEVGNMSARVFRYSKEIAQIATTNDKVLVDELKSVLEYDFDGV